jgi:hypothetical protein
VIGVGAITSCETVKNAKGEEVLKPFHPSNLMIVNVAKKEKAAQKAKKEDAAQKDKTEKKAEKKKKTSKKGE